MFNKYETIIFIVVSALLIFSCGIENDNTGDDEIKHPLSRIDSTEDNTSTGYIFADTISEHTGDELSSFPKDNATNGVKGGGENTGSLDVFVVGDGESFITSWNGNRIVNKSGNDFKVFENGFYTNSGEDRMSLDLGTVSVSKDGNSWTDFPVSYSSDPYENSSLNKSGFVGLVPVYLNMWEDELIEPASNDAGGDAFDLSDVDITDGDWIKYIKITDAGTTYPDGQIESNGIDIDGVCAFYWQSE